jgi:hypothetical protein
MYANAMLHDVYTKYLVTYCLSVNNLGCPVINHFGSELLVVIENKLTAKRNVEIVFITCKRT